MEHLRSALYLDFDNVFSGLLKLDPAVAMNFAQEPQVWLDRLAATTTPRRRWLVLRCYMNPAGSVADPLADGARVAFFRFRSAFTDAGFEVVDCPRLSHTKNGADIRLVIDAVEALSAEARYDEFVIGSGDSDMTPLLIRLRAADRGVTLVSPSDSAVVMKAVADRLIGGEELIELSDTRVDAVDAALDLGVDRARDGEVVLDEPDARARFEETIRRRYADAQEPLNLAGLGGQLRAELGSIATETRWFGHGGFAKAIAALGLPGARMAGQFMWDDRRHAPPEPAPIESATQSGPPVPAAVSLVSGVLKLPALTPASWLRIHESLTQYVRTHDYSLNEMTKWTRDRLVEEGVPINRQAASLVALGASYGGCPLYRQPPPDAAEVQQAFVANLLDRVDAADLHLSETETQDVRAWFSGSTS
jgi:hypothetical protein